MFALTHACGVRDESEHEIVPLSGLALGLSTVDRMFVSVTVWRAGVLGVCGAGFGVCMYRTVQVTSSTRRQSDHNNYFYMMRARSNKDVSSDFPLLGGMYVLLRSRVFIRRIHILDKE